jgi:hypothetical protein
MARPMTVRTEALYPNTILDKEDREYLYDWRARLIEPKFLS